jgi:transcriptional regulator with XRE-family HTH domain
MSSLKEVTLLRTHIGSTLRQARISQGRTLRDVAKAARVSLGYLSEVERGQKEASSELLNSICQALDLSLLTVITDVSVAIRATEAPSLIVVEAAA